MSLSKLDEYLRNIELIKKNKSNLIHNLKSIPVYQIAGQYYCEKQVELSLIHGEKENKSLKIGKEGHEADSFLGEKVTPQKAWEEAFRENRRKPYNIREFHLLIQYRKVFIQGRIDEVSFLKGKSLSITEFKFKRNKIAYYNDWVQLRCYGFLLYHSGFNVDNLEMKLLCFDPQDKDYALLLKDNDNMIDSKSFNKIFDFKKAKNEIDWALNYWLGKREAVPTKKAYKCFNCNYKDLCNTRINV